MKKSQQGETMSYTVSINSSGQATIPKAVREVLGVVPGENRLIFDIINGQVIVTKGKSDAEIFEENMRKIEAITDREIRTNPAFREAREKYKGMTYDEVMDAYYSTPEGKKELEEEYGVKL